MDFGPLCMGIACVMGGLFIITSIIFRWSWVVNHCKVSDVYKAFGETGATVFYVVLGSVFVIMGVFMLGWFIVEVMKFM
mgnify:CR=1 FL=1